MYGKLFDSMYDGTLYGQWEALVTFQQMIILADADGVIDITPPALAARTGIPLDIITRGIEVLESPDPYSRTEGEEGRRIIRIDDHRPWGWEIVNHNKYKTLQDADEVREQNRERKRRQRERKAEGHGQSRDVTDGHGQSRDVTDGPTMSRHTDTDTDKDPPYPPAGGETGFKQWWEAYPKKVGKQAAWRVWKRLRPDDALLASMLAALGAQRRSEQWTREGGRFVPNPATWLHQGRWEDEDGRQEARFLVAN